MGILVGVILEVARLLKVGQAKKKCIFLIHQKGIHLISLRK